MESVAFGVPTVTTTLSGFGQWILGNFDNSFEACGVNVIARGDSNYRDVAEAIASDLLRLSALPASATKEIAQAATTTAKAAAWEHFIVYYEEAYSTAIANAASRNESM